MGGLRVPVPRLSGQAGYPPHEHPHPHPVYKLIVAPARKIWSSDQFSPCISARVPRETPGNETECPQWGPGERVHWFSPPTSSPQGGCLVGAQHLLNGLLRSLQHVPTANDGSCFEGRGWSGVGIPLFCSTSQSDKLPLVFRPQLGHGFFQNIFIVFFHTGTFLLRASTSLGQALRAASYN